MHEGAPVEPLDSNLRALWKTYRYYADALSALPECTAYHFEKVGSSVVCRDSEGRWIHGPDDPLEAAREEARRMPYDQPTLYVVLRPGLGYLPFAILDEVEKRAPGSFLLLVEDRLDFFGVALSKVDWTLLIESVSTDLLLGKPDAVIPAFLKRHPAIALLPMVVVTEPASGLEADAAHMVEQLQSSAAQLRTAMESELAVADDAIRSRRARREPPRVLLAGPEFGYLSELIADGLRRCEASVEVRSGDTLTPRGLRVHDWVKDIAMLSPDIVLWMNRPELSRRGSEVLRALEVVNALWSVDSPYRMSLSRKDFGPIDLFLSFDPTYLSAASVLEAQRSAQLSIAVGIRPLPGVGPSDRDWPRRLGPDLSFVGSLGEARVQGLRDALRRENPHLLALLERLENDPDAGATYEKITSERYEGAPHFYVQEMRGQRRRLEVLSAFPEHSLKIFGGFDWAKSTSPLAAHHMGRPPRYGFELASIYYHSRINLNVFHDQCVDSTNSRVYDVLAAGGFLLTEHRPCLEREFEIGRHLVTFSTPAEGRERMEYYLTHGAEREAIAREGQRHVLEHHTFTNRCRRLLELAGGMRG